MASTPTRESALEARLTRTLVDGKTPHAATVLVEVGSGRVLAVVEHHARPAERFEGLATKPLARAASVFKVVTASALLRAGVPSSSLACFHGGARRMQAKLLVDDKRRDRTCTTLADAVAQSQNVAVAKLALAHLEPAALLTEASRWGIADGAVSVPDDPFGFAETAAGFGDVRMSALDGAVLAATVAQDGVRIEPRFDDDEPRESARVLEAPAAATLQRALADAVTKGTARKTFQAKPRIDVAAAGKTGSLADYSTGLETTWFVGYAPAHAPEVAVASVVVNTPVWHVRAPQVAKEALRAYFAEHPRAKRSDLVAVAGR